MGGPSSANAQPVEESAEPTIESAYEVAQRLFRGIESIHGFGLANAAFKDHTGKRLADLFQETYGDRALKRAQQFCSFINVAISRLKGAD